MKRFALLSTVVAIAALTLFATSAAQSGDSKFKKHEFSVGVMYDRFDCEPAGIFRIANAEGMFIEVCAATGELVWCGIVPEGYFEFGCPNHGEGVDGEVLRVRTASGAVFCIDRDDDWIWD